MNARAIEQVVLAWLRQGPQTLYVILDRLWDIDDAINAFELVEAMTILKQTHAITDEPLGGGDVRYSLQK